MKSNPAFTLEHNTLPLLQKNQEREELLTTVVVVALSGKVAVIRVEVQTGELSLALLMAMEMVVEAERRVEPPSVAVTTKL